MPKGTNNLPKKSPGRPKGSKDKITQNLKQLVLDAAAKLEAEGKSLHDEATKDPKWFYSNFIKPMLPKDVVLTGDPDNPLRATIEMTLVRPEDK